MEKKKVVIIGAGPAGISAAYELSKNEKYEIIVLEAQNQIGGISKTVNFDGNLVDTGIHRFFSKDDRINNIWKEFLPIQGKNSYDDIILQNNTKNLEQNGPDPETQENVLLIRDRITRIYYNKKFLDYPVSLNWTTIKNLGLGKMFIAGMSYLKSCIFKKKEDSLENFYINRFGKVLYSMFFEDYTEKVWGIHPSKISADWGSQRVKGVSIRKIIVEVFKKMFKIKDKEVETSLIESFYYPKLGAGQIWDVMAEFVEKNGGKIMKNTLVQKLIVGKNKKINTVEINENGNVKKIDADIVISSMPIKDLINNIENEEVPEDVKIIAEGLPYREFMSVAILTKKLNLKNTTNVKTINDVIPDSWVYIQEPEVKMGRLQVFNNWSPYIFENKDDIKDKVLLTLEYFCSEGDDFWNMSEKEFIDFAISEGEKINLFEKNDIIKSKQIKIKKAYPAYFGTYYNIDKVIEFLNSHENLYCIGRNGQHRYNNMDHSMLTGIIAAQNIINGVNDKKEIWNVNTEKEYHEKK